MRIPAVALACLLSVFPVEAKPKRAKNVILLLADAGGISTIHAASLFGYNAPLKLFVQTWPNMGLSDTTPHGRWVSDSAAGMTAIVTGQKTQNGFISQGPDGIRGKKNGTELKTILEYAEERGLSTGVMSNVTITDATPAACYAHVNDRASWGDIFLQIFSPKFGDGVDIVFGPGRKAIYDRVTKAGKDLDAVAKEKGRPVYSTLGELPADAKRGIVVTDGEFDLNTGAKQAIRMLSQNKKGFFLMIESDAHTSNPDVGLNRLVRFDKLIRELTEIANPEETLFLFTADHSFDLLVAGGGPDKPLLTGLDEWKKNGGGKSIRLAALRVDGSHTGEEVLVAARGPGSERVRGYMPNTNLFSIMMQAFGWKADTAEAESGRP
jgi:alkaline phosphatase